MKTTKTKTTKTRNYVVQHALQFSKASTFTDRKRNSKRGYTKHRNQLA